jgi:crossover junction endodeoxyribonuclease RusA
VEKTPIQRFVLPWPPSVNHYWRITPPIYSKRTRKHIKASIRVSSEGLKYRKTIIQLLRVQSYKPLGAARIGIFVYAYPPDNRKRDLDNILKSLLDALQKAAIYDDDSQIDDIQVVRGEKIKAGQVDLQIWAQDV